MELKQEIQTRYILHWNYRRYTKIPQELLDFGRNIEEIYFKENGLLELPQDFAEKLPKLTQLYLYGNSLEELPESIGNLPNLQILDLAHNRLQNLPNTIGNLTSLNTLDLSHNQLSELPQTIGSLQNLSALIVVKNNLKKLPKCIKNCKNLQSLHLNGNQLETIPSELCKCENLKDLYLESNEIKSIPEEITQLHFLNHVNLAKNNLQDLPALPFISEAKINFEENSWLCEIPFIFGCQQNYLKLLSPSRRTLDPQQWHFSVRGCGTQNPDDKLVKTTLVKLNKSPASMLEQCLRKVYLNCFQPQIMFKNDEKVFKRFPRIFKNQGKNILNEMPKSLKMVLLKGPKTFCCHCLQPIFHETFAQKIRAPFANLPAEENIYTIFYFCSQTCQQFLQKQHFTEIVPL